MHSIFKIGISRNMKCAYMVGFLKYSHICPLIAIENFAQHYIALVYSYRGVIVFWALYYY